MKKYMDKKYYKNPEQYIPHGPYCYDENGPCPFWDMDETKTSQENGYCHYLQKGDSDLEKEMTLVERKTGEVSTGDNLPFPVSLLWDAVKMCDVNEEEC